MPAIRAMVWFWSRGPGREARVGGPGRAASELAGPSGLRLGDEGPDSHRADPGPGSGAPGWGPGRGRATLGLRARDPSRARPPSMAADREEPLHSAPVRGPPGPGGRPPAGCRVAFVDSRGGRSRPEESVAAHARSAARRRPGALHGALCGNRSSRLHVGRRGGRGARGPHGGEGHGSGARSAALWRHRGPVRRALRLRRLRAARRAGDLRRGEGARAPRHRGGRRPRAARRGAGCQPERGRARAGARRRAPSGACMDEASFGTRLGRRSGAPSFVGRGGLSATPGHGVLSIVVEARDRSGAAAAGSSPPRSVAPHLERARGGTRCGAPWHRWLPARGAARHGCRGCRPRGCSSGGEERRRAIGRFAAM